MTEFHRFAEAILIPCTLACAMLGMGATLSLGQFGLVFRDPRGLLIGLALQLIAVPLIALGFVTAFGLSGGWAIGLYLIAVIPGGAFSNLLTFLARGSTPLSISMTVASTTACVFTVPLVLGLLAGSALPADFHFPTGQIIVEIGLFLIVPLLAGMVLYRFRQSVADRVSTWAIRASVVLICVISVSAMASGRLKIFEYGLEPLLLIILFGLTIAMVPPLIARALGRSSEDIVAVGIEITVRNVPVALLLLRFFFPGDEAQAHVLYTCLLYAGLSMVLAIPMVLRHRAGRSVIPFDTPRHFVVRPVTGNS